MVVLPHRSVFRVSGADREKFLQGILSNDIKKAGHDKLLYALLLTPQGKFLYDFFITKLSECYLLDVSMMYSAELLKKLNMYRLRSEVVIEAVSDLRVVVSEKNEGAELYSDPRDAALCYRGFVMDSALNTSNSSSEMLAQYHERRVDLKISELGIDFSSQVYFPFELGLLSAIDYSKGCYIGQEVVARTTYRGVVRKGVFKLFSDSDLEFLKPGAEIILEDKAIGVLMQPYRSRSLAMLNIERAQECLESGKMLSVLGEEGSVIKCYIGA